ncbi:protein of unknown function [Azospirillum baldaniorum]|uniref:Uncharacterized protein n=1 Tax=Azospirillum baldaniorum TaxID=1064539 RepID=A0A9P1JSN0_9PROT|nr:protein of unknown function [Azospirillum baldaniorum]
MRDAGLGPPLGESYAGPWHPGQPQLSGAPMTFSEERHEARALRHGPAGGKRRQWGAPVPPHRCQPCRGDHQP